MHDLRIAYINKCKDVGHIIRGDKDPEKTIIAAQKVARLGLSYEEYIELAFALLKSLCEHQGWQYPWYNLVISDSTISRIGKLLELETGRVDNIDAKLTFERQLAEEYQYLTEYLAWAGGEAEKPIRTIFTDKTVKIRAAEQFCINYGISPIIKNYNKLAQLFHDSKSRSNQSI
jgi:hypothetical protein